MAKVSICIPTYNNADGVERLLDSVVTQTYGDYEVIITDDSVDNKIQLLTKKYPFVRYYKNPVRLGATANWNEAITKSSGEYIKIMHHDDWFTMDTSLEVFVALLDNNKNYVLAFSGSAQATGEVVMKRCISEEDVFFIQGDYRNLFMGNTIGAPSAMIYRRGKERFDENLKWLVDMEFYMQLLQEGTFHYTKAPLVTIGVSANQLTEECRDDKALNKKEYGYIYDKYGLWKVPCCRQKLMGILADGGTSFAEAAQFKIGKIEYGYHKIQKFVGKVKWKLGLRDT